VQLSQYDYHVYGLATPLLYEDEWRRELKHAFEQDWCAPLSGSPVWSSRPRLRMAVRLL